MRTQSTPTVKWVRTLAILAVAALVAAAGPPPTLGSAQASPHDPWGPVADWGDDVDDDADDVNDDGDAAKSIVGQSAGPLDEPDRTLLALKLEKIALTIETVLDPALFPSIDPPDAGSIDQSYAPATLPDYAADVAALAKRAKDELDQSDPDPHVVGTAFKTIRHLIQRASPHSYRSLAGIS